MSSIHDQAVSATLPAHGDVQGELARAVRLFAEQSAQSEKPLAAFPSDAVTATDAMIAVTAILKAVNIQVFELGMWQSFNGR